MKKLHLYLLIGSLALASGLGIYAIHKTKKVQFSWHTSDDEFGERMCENCTG